MHSRYEKQLKVVGLIDCNDLNQVRVTLKPYGGKSKATINRNLPCTVDSLRHFRHVFGNEVTSTGYKKGSFAASTNHCLGCSDTWLYYINPFHWADAIWNSTRLIITVVLILCAVTILALSIKICMCLKKCCF